MLVLNILQLRKYSVSENFLVNKSRQFSEFLTESFYRVYFVIYEILDKVIPKFYDKLLFFCFKFYDIFGHRSEATLIFVTLFVRTILLIAFFIDVFIFFKLHYFYVTLVLLLIPLCIKVLIFILEDFSKALDEIKSYLIIEDCGIDEETNLPLTNYKPSPGNEKIDLYYYVEQFIICNKITGYLKMYNMFLNFCNPRFNIIYNTLFLVGWILLCISIVINTRLNND